MKVVEALHHCNKISGCYLYDDGMAVHWSEGSASDVDIIKPDGTHVRMPVYMFVFEGIDEVKCRLMTPEEESQHNAVRNACRPTITRVS